jgi:hypothetical protein
MVKQTQTAPIETQEATFTVTWGMQKLSPVQYQTLDVGPFSMQVTTKPGETPQEAFVRAYDFLAKQAQAVYKREMPAFLERVRESAGAARGR